MALNYLYECKSVSTSVMMQFMREENERVSNQFKSMKTGTGSPVTEEKIKDLETSVEKLETSNERKDKKIADLEEKQNKRWITLRRNLNTSIESKDKEMVN